MVNHTLNQEHVELLEEKHQNTLKNIKELQDMEKYMYESLAKLANEGGSSEQEDQIIGRINELTQLRVNLFSQLKNSYTDAADELNDSRRSLRDQILAVNLVEEELKRTKNNYDVLVNNKNNKVRMVEIGNYQAQRYNAHIGVLKILSLTALVVLVLSVLYHKEILPGNLTSVLIMIAMSVGGIVVIRKVFDLMTRSNFVYDQYNWGTNHAELQPGYQGILEHDKLFFEKLGKGIENEVSSGESQLKNAAQKISSTMTEEINKETNVHPDNSKTSEGFSLYH